MSTNTVEHRTQHTPGPWELKRYGVGFSGAIIAIPTGYNGVGAHIAQTSGAGTIDPKQDAANARLIAAAPELLEAAQFLFGAIESGELVRDISRDAQADCGQRMMHFTVNLGKAQAAIMKATQE